MTEELKEKLMQFLAEEVELLEDFGMDVDNPEVNNRNNARSIALWSKQSSRVGAIKDTLEILGFKLDN